MIYFSSDLHFNHQKSFLFQPRNFNSIEEMNQTIINNFNSTLTNEDDLYLLGDIFLGGPNSIKAGIELFKQLHGKIHLIWGNHDTDNRKFAMSQCSHVIETIGYAGIFKYKKYHFYLSHYPTITTNFDDYQKPLKQRLICLAGHTHSKEKFEPCGSYNVSVDAHNCFPVSIEQIIEDIKNHYYE